MRLYIGKNHEGDTTPVQSIFRLAGHDEDALTFALGFLLAHDRDFCAKLVRRFGLSPRRRLQADYAIRLQEVTDNRYGRRDIVIEDSETRIVFEAKIGDSEPTAEQLFKYADEESLWSQYKGRVVVALTQVKLSAATRDEVSSKLSKKVIEFREVQWHEVFDLVIKHSPSDGSGVTKYLFGEFIRYIRSNYNMRYHDAEVHIQDVNPLNAGIFEEGWMYVTSPKDKKAPLYFAPYYTDQNPTPGISLISRVRGIEEVVIGEKLDIGVAPPSDEHGRRWRSGLARLRRRAEDEQEWLHSPVRLLYLDRPMKFATTPITKKSFNDNNPPTQIPNQIPKGFSLGFDELVLPNLGAVES